MVHSSPTAAPTNNSTTSNNSNSNNNSSNSQTQNSQSGNNMNTTTNNNSANNSAAATATPTPTVAATPNPTTTPAPIQSTPSPTPTATPTITSSVNVLVVQHLGNQDYNVSGAKIKVVNHNSGEQLGLGFTTSSGWSQTWTVPANSAIDVYAYPPNSPDTSLCGSVWSIANTGPYGDLWSQTMRIYPSGQNPCIHE